MRFDTVIGSFDDVPLRDFLKDKEVFFIRDHFFIKNEVPSLLEKPGRDILAILALAPGYNQPSKPAPTQEESNHEYPTTHDDLPIFVFWTGFLTWLLPTTEKFPKKVRFPVSKRIDNLALDLCTRCRTVLQSYK